ncbi:BrnA antitoxin family protein [Glaciimonas soli]|uniref:BrnA antitoxin of type II toxin-antitoxin system n=1 Tax=Glaciimonas soli TaxID=2590999 RepID=A0A843YZF2_9BURK|nr:BrnA antitoxin family protein [Glaciimonas soli]MQR01916.1 hypothetical protein [Glaciimonas soli]
MNSKREIIYPTDEEDAAITAAALSDPDALPWTAEELAKVKPTRGPGRPLGSGSKEQVTLRLDTDILAAFKRDGDGWQTRMNFALGEWLREHGSSTVNSNTDK